MAKGKPRPWPDVDRLRAIADKHDGVIVAMATTVAREIGDGQPVTSQALTTVLRRVGLLEHVRSMRAERGSINSGGAEDVIPGARTITSDDPAKLGTLRELLEENGVNPDEWIPVRGRFNRWGDPANYSRQVRVDVVPRLDLLTPVRTDGWTPPDRAKYAGEVDESLTLILGDDHAPWHDEALAAATVEWLREFKPAAAAHIGDVLNYERLSKHMPTPRFDASVKDSNQRAAYLMKSRVDASPGTRWRLAPGNHDHWLRRLVLKMVPQLHDVPQVKLSDDEPDRPPVLSLKHILRLDELGIEYPEVDDDWDRFEIDIAPGVVAVHAGATRKRSGQSAMAAIEDAGLSTYMGHVHRQAVVWRRQKRRPPFFGCEIGTGAQHDLGYGSKEPDWHAGFATNSLTDDGISRPELAMWTGERLLWRDWDCRP